ncbi:MAG: RNA polymerase sigma factor [Thermomicrobiales bacterium]
MPRIPAPPRWHHLPNRHISRAASFTYAAGIGRDHGGRSSTIQSDGRHGHGGRDDRLAEPSDDLYLVALTRNDLSEFARIYDKYVPVVHRYCHRRLGSVHAAEDATSTVFLKAMAALPAFSPGAGSFRSWLFAIAHNVIVDQVRQTARRMDQALEAGAELADRSGSPEAQALTSESGRDMAAAMAQLTGEQRRVVELRLAGLTGQEIAATLGTTHGAVRAAQHRALLRLHEIMTDTGRCSEIRPHPRLHRDER